MSGASNTTFLPKTAALAGVVAALGLAVGWQASRWSSPANVQVPRSDLIQPLRTAIRNGDRARVETVLSQEADINAADEDGETPLMVAAVNADVEMMRLLLDRGAAPNAHSRQGDPVLLRAIHDREKGRLLLEHGAGVDDKIVVIAAGVPGSRPILELLERAGGNLQADVNGFTTLMAAAYCGDLDCVRFLLKRGADVKARTSAGLTALVEAALSGNAAVVHELLERGADPNAFYQLAPDGPFLTPVLAAATLGEPASLMPLLERGAKVNVQGGPFGATPLLCAATTGSEETVRLLLNKGADPHATDWKGDTPVTWARRRGKTKIVALLRDASAERGARSAEQPFRSALRAPRSALEAAAAVRRSLPLLQPSAAEFTHRRGCVSCHHQSHLAVTLSLARSRGLAVDETLATQEREHVVAFFRAKPETILGQGLDPLLAAWTLWAWEAEGRQPGPLTDALVHYLVLLQSADGSWRTPGYRPPADGSHFTFTALALRGLQHFGAPGRRAELQPRIERARDWLLKNTPEETEDLVWQLLGLYWAQPGAEAVQKAAERLLGEQRPDGGWAQLPTLPSDAYATGEALYALHSAGALSPSDPAYQRGTAFLLQTQLADGSWLVPTRSFPVIPYFNSGFPHGRDQFISTSATCWATMALLVSLRGR